LKYQRSATSGYKAVFSLFNSKIQILEEEKSIKNTMITAKAAPLPL